jgi:hypothetical protein
MAHDLALPRAAMARADKALADNNKTAIESPAYQASFVGMARGQSQSPDGA